MGHPRGTFLFNPAYLQVSRNGVFYLRWPLPKQRHPYGKPSCIKVSLRTRNPRIALRLSRSLGLLGDELMDNAPDDMTYAEVRNLLKGHFQALLDKRRALIDAGGRLSVLDREVLKTSVQVAKQALKTGDPLSLVEDDGAMLSAFMLQSGVNFPPDSEQYGWLADEMKRSYRDYAKQVLAYDASLDAYDFSPSTPSGRAEPAVSSTQSQMTLRELATSYRREKQVGDNWVAKTKLEKGDHIELLEEILGSDFDIEKLAAAHAKQVKDVLLSYPKNRGKNPATRGKALADALLVQNVEKISVPTINKYLQTYNDMFEWARRNSHVDANLFSGLTIRQNKKRGQIERSAFNSEQVRMMLNVIVANEEGLVRKDYQKWGPLIAIYSGARLNEIAQIHLQDIRKEGDIWCFDLNDEGEGKHLKTSASRRLVPIHGELLRLGLLQHVKALQEAGKQKLFPDFSYDPSNGWGRTLGRWFNESLLPKLNLKTKALVFHSLRHTVVTRLMQSDVPEPIVKALVGHEQQGVTQQHYFKQGYTVAQLSEAIARLTF